MVLAECSSTSVVSTVDMHTSMKDGSLTDCRKELAEKLIKMELCIPERSGLGWRMEKELELPRQKGKSRRIK